MKKKVNISKLKIITELLFKKMEMHGIEEVEILEDYYWYIPKDLVYNPNEDPVDFTIGQISYDWDTLCKTLDEDRAPIMHELVNLSIIFRFLGDYLKEY